MSCFIKKGDKGCLSLVTDSIITTSYWLRLSVSRALMSVCTIYFDELFVWDFIRGILRPRLMPRQSPGEPPPCDVDERSVGGLLPSNTHNWVLTVVIKTGFTCKLYDSNTEWTVDCPPQMSPVTVHDREWEGNYNWPSPDLFCEYSSKLFLIIISSVLSQDSAESDVSGVLHIWAQHLFTTHSPSKIANIIHPLS